MRIIVAIFLMLFINGTLHSQGLELKVDSAYYLEIRDIDTSYKLLNNQGTYFLISNNIYNSGRIPYNHNDYTYDNFLKDEKTKKLIFSDFNILVNTAAIKSFIKTTSKEKFFRFSKIKFKKDLKDKISDSVSDTLSKRISALLNSNFNLNILYRIKKVYISYFHLKYKQIIAPDFLTILYPELFNKETIVLTGVTF